MTNIPRPQAEQNVKRPCGVFVTQWPIRDPTLLDKGDKYIIKESRKNIHKFERTYDSIDKILDLAYVGSEIVPQNKTPHHL